MLPDLGLSITRANGKPMVVKEDPNPIVSHVRLVQSSTIPSLKGQFLPVQAECTLPESSQSQVLFEPKRDIFESLGIHSHEAMISVCEDGHMYVPVHNCEGVSAHLEEGIEVGVIRSVKPIDVNCSDIHFTGPCEKSDGAAHELSDAADDSPTSVCARVQGDTSERTEKLLEALELPVDKFLKMKPNSFVT